MINLNLAKRLIRICLVVCALSLALTCQAIAREEILSFISHIHVHEDSTMTVTEEITAKSEGAKIKRGIYRDFPTEYTGKLGNKIKVGFEIIEILRNGKKEPFHTKSLSNGIRIYIGNKGRNVPTGEHTYSIKYKTNQQLGFFETHDELYWNVTGNGWDFPILSAKASVHLPDSIQSSEVVLEAYTGRTGSTQQNYESEINYSGNYVFKSSQTLNSREGLTIVVSWPKGYVAEPSFGQKMQWWAQANIQSPITIIGILGLLLFYFISWWRVGKDPKGGVIIPHYQPPKGFPPGGLRYINEMGHDKQAFTAAVLNLAVKGYLRIEETENHFELHKIKEAGIRLPIGEHTIHSNLFGKHSSKVALKTKNHEIISTALKEHKKVLEQEYSQSYFINNRKILFIGIAITLIIISFIYLNLPSSNDKGSAFFLTVWLSGWTPFTVLLVYAWYKALRRKLSFGSAYEFGVMSIFAGVWSCGEIGALLGLASIIGIFNAFLIVLLFLANVLFYFLLKKPTLEGRKLLDKVEGFKKYLEVAEQEELNLKYPPKKTPKLFETYLPFALALGVENPWVDQFTEVFNTSNEGTSYHPTWYSGNNWNTNNLSGFANSVGGSLSSAISSSSTAPGSSSGGGGGGSSGGGGGGGGGGGW